MGDHPVPRKIDLESWNRRRHFENFKSYGDPFFNITAEVEVSDLRRRVRERNASFFAASYFLVLKIVLGKCTEEGGRFVMPISVSGHHALMDGIHAGLFFEKYEQYASTLL